MFDCFKKKESTRPVVVEPQRPINTIGPSNNIPIGLVVGHNSRSQGAINYLGESEFVFGNRIAKKVQAKLADNMIRTAIINRPAGVGYSKECEHVAKMVRELKVSFTLHLHFNAASSKAVGCEALICETSSNLDNVLADRITDLLNERFKFKERGEDGVKTIYSGHNGYGMLHAVREAGAIPVLIEPTFAHYRHKESIVIFEQEDLYVDILAQALYEIARGEVKNGFKLG